MGQECSSSLLIDNNSDINHCIEQTAFASVPLFILLVGAISKLSEWSKKSRKLNGQQYASLSLNDINTTAQYSDSYSFVQAQHLQYNNVDFLRQSLAFLLFLLPLCTILVSFLREEMDNPKWYEVYFAIISSFTAFLSMMILHKTVLMSIGRNAVFLASIWAINVLVLSLILFSTLKESSDNEVEFKHISFFVYYGFSVLLLLVLALFNAPMAKPKQRSGSKIMDTLKEPLLDDSAKPAQPSPMLPEPYAGLFRMLTFSWLNPIMAIGYKRALKQEDLYDLHPKEKANKLNEKLRSFWAKEQSKHRGKPSFVRALRKAFGPTFYVSCFFKWIYDSLTFVGPQLLNRMITFLDSQSGDDPEPVWYGVAFIVLLFINAVVQSCVLHQYFHRAFRTGMRLKSSIITVVYQKALRIKPGQTKLQDDQKDAKKDSEETKEDDQKSDKASTGEIVNLMSVDAQRLQDLMSYFSILFSAPYQIVLSLVFLWGQLGPSIFAGVGVMILMVPISGKVARTVKVFQRKLMAVKDNRIKVTNEVLAGMSIIKLYAWEESFKKKVEGLRNEELKHLKNYLLVNCISRVLWTIVPVLVALATFTAYILSGNELTAAKAFTAIALFNILRFPLAFFPIMISNAMEASLSVDRIQRFLLLPEIHDLPILGPAGTYGLRSEDNRGSGSRVGVFAHQATLNWDDGAPLLADITMEVPQGKLTCIIGQTGSGKSGFLQALIGDLKPSAGMLEVNGKIGYTSQVAWIQNATLKDNILFGKPYDPDWYRCVLDACALLPDLDILPSGDQTEIGERGINLSGGQKQRVAIARAVYQKADIYLMDDPLSAVDSHVASHIFEKCIRGLLKEKSVVLVTHNLHMLPPADQIFLLDNKVVAFSGTYKDLTESGLSFADILHSEEDEEEGDEEEKDGESAPGGVKSRQASVRRISSRQPSRKFSRQISKDKETERAQSVQKAKATDVLVEKETVAKGAVSKKIYLEYIKGCGGYGSFFLGIFTLLLNQGAQVGGNSWLSYWSDNDLNGRLGLGIYGALGGVSAFAALICLVKFSLAGVASATYFHKGMLESLIRAPMSFYDTTPLGRILNRFSKDTYTIDEVLMTSIYSYLSTLFSVLATVAVIGFVTPYFLLAMIPPALLYYFTQQYYVASSRELKRLDSVSRSPIFSHFAETLDGVPVIRAFRRQFDFVKENESKLDHNLQAYYINIASNRWLAMRLEFVGTCIVALAACFAVIGRNNISAGLGGLSISYALSITQTLNWMVRMTSERETNIVAVERVQEYITEVDSEAPAIIPENRPPKGWPQNGQISLRKVSMRYRPGLPLVLRTIDLEVAAGMKVGIVGRTGAGKSSMLKVLLRLVEPCAGEVLVDGINIQKIGLQDLRSRFSIIPQDPVLFTGTVRFNLDPFEEYEDADIWAALRRAHLSEHIQGCADQLKYQVEEAGRNFSMGERQLLCMARALLRRSKILLLDEATSAVDHQTDSLIQETIRSEFSRSTVMTIAHRVDTIVDYDRVLVLSDGKILENDAPSALLKNPQSEFYKIWDAHQKGMKV